MHDDGSALGDVVPGLGPSCGVNSSSRPADENANSRQLLG